MRKIYSLVLMATALLIGTNTWAEGNVAKIGSTEYASIEAAWNEAQNGNTIQLISDATISKQLWLGTATMEDANPKSITLDLNGFLLEGSSSVQKLFFITHGELNVISSRPNGRITHLGNKDNDSKWEIFRVGGSTYKNLNPRTAINGYYSHLVIGENVILNARSNGIVIDRVNGEDLSNSATTKNAAKPSSNKLYNTNIYNHNGSAYGSAYGARVDVYGKVEAYKYAIKTNGNLGSPVADVAVSTINSYKANPTDESGVYTGGVVAADTVYTPFVRLYSSSDLSVTKNSDNTKKPVAVYASGYARWLIEGTCVGSIAVYIKSGKLDINDATISSNYDGDYKPAVAHSGSGVEAAGSAIAMESADAYSGAIDVTISGDTKVTATNGYAIDEAVTNKSDTTKVHHLTITGGTFEGGDVRTAEEKDQNSDKYIAEKNGTMQVSEPTATAAEDVMEITTITIIGASASNGTSSIGNKPLAEFLADDPNTETHITYVENEQGKQVMVISEGAAPDEGDAVNGNMVSQQSTDARIKWTVNQKDTIKSNLKLAELEINTDGLSQELVIKDGATLEVGRVVLGKDAKIIVEPGAKFIVSGKYGIVAPVVDNIVLESDFQTAKYATFLFNPGVQSNKHPNATVEFATYSFRDNSVSPVSYQTQRFGVPTYEAVQSIKSDVNGMQTRIQYWGTNGWENLGDFVQGTSEFANINRLDQPFGCYILLAYQKDPGAKYTMTGKLVGNVNAQVKTRFEFTPFANSYTADLDIIAMLEHLSFAYSDDEYIYVATPKGNNGYSWNPIDGESLVAFGSDGKIAPLQPFIIHNSGEYAEEHELNYEYMAWDPVMDPSHAVVAGAPRRAGSVSDNTAKLRVVISNEQGELDDVKMIETIAKTKRAAKYMNDDVNIYAHMDVNSAVVMNDNLTDTYFGFSTVSGGEYTISFDNVDGREFDFIDLETGAKVAVKEGETYKFHADANTVNDYRFEIVDRQNMPTAIDNTEAVKSVKGIYTITGQYVGEMNVWNTLPAGVYVVNGEKRVK